MHTDNGADVLYLRKGQTGGLTLNLFFMVATVLFLMAAGVGIGLGGWMAYQLFHQHGRLLSRLQALEAQLVEFSTHEYVESGSALAAPTAPAVAANEAPRIPIGTLAPAFTLPDLAGQPRSLDHFRGRRVLLIFFNPLCGFCDQMAPHLAALTGNMEPIPLIVTQGDAAMNRRWFEEHQVNLPILVHHGEVAQLYGVQGTPMGYLIDEEGRIASELAVGAPALLALTLPSASAPTDAPSTGAESGHGAGLANISRPLSESKLKRDGLTAGTLAPDFSLPQVDGGLLSLNQYRGERVLLVFSDPHCGPCNELAPRLEQAARDRTDVHVIMISRGSEEENRRKIAEFALTFPVVLQKQWEISRLYAMFATPIGYLIDAEGVIARPVGIGADGILSLLEPAT